jgi:hypothetical protein
LGEDKPDGPEQADPKRFLKSATIWPWLPGVAAVTGM